MKQNFELLEQLLQRRDFHALRAALTEENPVDIALFLETLTQEQAVLAFRTLPKEKGMHLAVELVRIGKHTIVCFLDVLSRTQENSTAERTDMRKLVQVVQCHLERLVPAP